jgi:hypothetical protein
MRLEIVVAPWCPTCAWARALAEEVRAGFPDLEVTVVELDGRQAPPPGVVATPTYLLDGVVISLGNPRRQDLARLLAARLGRSGPPPLDGTGPTRADRPLAAGGSAPPRPGPLRRPDGAMRAAPVAVSAPGGWLGRALGAGLLGALITSSCCLPAAVAIALGLSLGTIATLEHLLAYQRLFQAAGMATARFASWWAPRRCRATCDRRGRRAGRRSTSSAPSSSAVWC